MKLRFSKSLSLNKDVCLWVVPPHDGKVRKIRFSVRRMLVAFAMCFALMLGGIFMAGDYARLMFLKGKIYYSMHKLSNERDSLVSKNDSLSSEVKDLQSANSRVLSYERNLKARMDELGSILDSAGELGLMTKGAIDKQARSLNLQRSKDRPTEGLGGAELDCEGPGGATRCAPLVENDDDSSAADAPYAMLNSNRLKEESGGSLIERLDGYIDILRSLPLGMPGDGHVTSGYGFRVSPFGSRIRMHEGVDLSLPAGSYIYSTGDGVVRTVERNATYGLMVDIAHSNKVITRYAHLSRTFVTVGEKVCRGENIALVGSTGHSTGPHLHYEVRINGKANNPSKFIDLASRLSAAAPTL